MKCAPWVTRGEQEQDKRDAESYFHDPAVCLCGAKRKDHKWIDFGVYGGCQMTGCQKFEPKDPEPRRAA